MRIKITLKGLNQSKMQNILILSSFFLLLSKCYDFVLETETSKPLTDMLEK